MQTGHSKEVDGGEQSPPSSIEEKKDEPQRKRCRCAAGPGWCKCGWSRREGNK